VYVARWAVEKGGAPKVGYWVRKLAHGDRPGCGSPRGRPRPWHRAPARGPAGRSDDERARYGARVPPSLSHAHRAVGGARDSAVTAGTLFGRHAVHGPRRRRPVSRRLRFVYVLLWPRSRVASSTVTATR